MIDILESKVVGTNKETWYRLVGTSEDTKPIGEFPAGTGHTVAKNSTFFEIGTQIKYEFDGSAWAPKGQVDIKLIEKTITENGTYDPADDDADGYSSVMVNIPEPQSENNAKLENTKSVALFSWDIDMLTFLSVPEGFTGVQSKVTTAVRLKHIVLPSTLQTLDSTAFAGALRLETITINKPEGSIPGAPWGARDACQIIWTG